MKARNRLSPEKYARYAALNVLTRENRPSSRCCCRIGRRLAAGRGIWLHRVSVGGERQREINMHCGVAFERPREGIVKMGYRLKYAVLAFLELPTSHARKAMRICDESSINGGRLLNDITASEKLFVAKTVIGTNMLSHQPSYLVAKEHFSSYGGVTGKKRRRPAK